MTLGWQPPEGPSVVEYVVTRSKTVGSEHGRAAVVYRGSATEFTDRELSSGVRYRYTVFAHAWYVWPGLGLRAQGRYGKPLGRSVFVVTAPKANLP